jgi:hypothetical protein
MLTTLEAREAKRQLCRDICAAIREFEYEYGVGVADIRLIRSQTLADPSNHTVVVEVIGEDLNG